MLVRPRVIEVMDELAAQLGRRAQRGLMAKLAKPGLSAADLAERVETIMPQILAVLPGSRGTS